MDSRTERFIEQMGLAMEADGHSRIAGRLLGLLLLSPGHRSLDELAASLGVSKASISTNARRLEERGVLERVARPGDRRDYYRIAHDFFIRTVRYRMGRWQRFHDMLRDAREHLPIQSLHVRERLGSLEEEFGRLSEEIEQMLERTGAAWSDEGRGRMYKR